MAKLRLPFAPPSKRYRHPPLVVPQKIYLSGVQYIDFAASAMPTGNVFLPALHKCRDLHSEKEVRILMLQTGDQKAFSSGSTRGIELPIDLRSLIQGIRLAPRSAGWLHNLMLSLAERHGLSYEPSIAELTSINEQLCRFKSTDGCLSCNRSFVPVESLHEESLVDLCT